MMRRAQFAILSAGFLVTQVVAGSSFVNWENAHVYPMDITPNGSMLVMVNTADARLEVFDISSGLPIHSASIPVGLDPVSVRARSDQQVWVVNHISDSVSVVDLESMNVVTTIDTLDEPADVVFAGNPEKAYVSCSQVNTVQVFDADDPLIGATQIAIDAEEPRAMAVSADGSQVYVAVFESGNCSTILGGGAVGGVIAFPPNVVNNPLGPYGGTNPPPNDGSDFDPPMNLLNPSPPPVGLIVKKDNKGRWMDDNNGDWTDLVSGPNAHLSGRPVGWDLPDHDVAIIDTQTLTVEYATRLMNICMAIAVQPGTGDVTVVGTDGTNEIRFEPVIDGKFLRVNLARFNPLAAGNTIITDLNGHLTYTTSTIPQNERDLALGDPRGIVWNQAGTRAFVSGMGSNNVVVYDASGNRAGLTPTIEVGEGPTGLALDESRNRLYVLNKFAGNISVIDTVTETELDRVQFFDPTPTAIKTGRKHLYDTHKTSGLGHMSCASCHIDARMDRLAWDLGDPSGDMRPFNQNCNFNVNIGPACEDWHPMKGPMTTQTLQDIIGKEPHHWRGDRNGLEEFNGAFLGLMGDDQPLTTQEMQEYEDFLASVTFGPNPFRNFDNSLPTSLPLTGHFTPGRFGPAGLPLPNGNAQAGLQTYRTDPLDEGGIFDLNCVTCHTLPTGMGTNLHLTQGSFSQFPVGADGELHHALVSVDGSSNVSIKIPHLRNLHEKVGFEATQTSNLAGFGYIHDGSVDSIARFVAEPVFNVTSVQHIADLVAFMLAFSGSDMPTGSTTNLFELLGPDSKDTHAAVGKQLTLDQSDTEAFGKGLLGEMKTLADNGAVGLVAKGLVDGKQRGYAYVGADTFQSDLDNEALDSSTLTALADEGSEITFTVVPVGTQTRIGIDRDEDGYYDRDELDACSDPADAEITPPDVVITGDADDDNDVDWVDFAEFLTCITGPDAESEASCRCKFDLTKDGDVDFTDFREFQIVFTGR